MARSGSVSKDQPLDAAELQQRIDLARRLIALAAEQQRQSLLNLDLARTGLAEVITDLELRGMAQGGGQ